MTDVPEELAPRLAAVPRLEAHQASLHEAFKRRCPRIAHWYMSAIQLMNNADVIDHVPAASHCLREVMEKFPECAGLKIIDVAGNAARVLRIIERDFGKLKRCRPAEIATWAGEIDNAIRKFVGTVESKLAQYEQGASSRTVQTRSAFRAMDPVGKLLPPVYEDANIRAWSDLRGYFANVAHHTLEVTEAEFRLKIAEFETLAGAKIAPTPTDEADLIDKLIREAERGDQP